jgi:L-lysine 2,3-aminomutase
MTPIAEAVRPELPLSPIADTLREEDVRAMLDRYHYPEETRAIIERERLLPRGMLSRLQLSFPQYSSFKERTPFLFPSRAQYEGLKGFREVVGVLRRHGIELGRMVERELFVEVYRFKATSHILNAINWENHEPDSLYQLVFPQPGMMRPAIVARYAAAATDEARRAVIDEYMEQTNPHDGHQLLNKPWIERADGGIDIVEGSQHKYPQCQLVFDKTTQSCFAFCTYCFRHAQVRGDDDMFVQDDIAQIHEYLRGHQEVTDLLITGGDAGYLPYERLRQYVMPILEDPRLLHVRTVRIASRALTFQPEMILTEKYGQILELFQLMHDNGVQLSWMAHFSTPRELLNPSTIAAIRRLQAHGVVVRSQSPIMNHVSLFMDADGHTDIQRTAQNWIDLAHILAALNVRFHSMYCARPTGEHHYFTAPLADIEKVSNLIFRSLSSLHRPSRYITMTTSAGKLSILGEASVGGRKALALKFNEARNMEWMDKVFLAVYDETENRVDRLVPFDGGKFFFEEELHAIEQELEEVHGRRLAAGHHA